MVSIPCHEFLLLKSSAVVRCQGSIPSRLLRVSNGRAVAGEVVVVRGVQPMEKVITEGQPVLLMVNHVSGELVVGVSSRQWRPKMKRSVT